MTVHPENSSGVAKNPPSRFVPGQSGNPAGKPPGPNKSTRLLREAILVAAELAGERVAKRELRELIEKHGEILPPHIAGQIVDATGLTRYLIWMAENEPKSFATLLGRVLPLQLAGEFKVDASTGLAALMEAVNGRTRSVEK